MLENVTSLTGISTLVTGIGAGIAWIIARRDRRKDPVPKQTVQVALAERSVGIAQRQLESMRIDLDRLRADRDTDLERITTLEDRIAVTDRDLTTTRRTLEDLRLLFFAATTHLENVLRWARSGHPPPPPVVPELLKDHIDPSLQDWDTT